MNGFRRSSLIAALLAVTLAACAAETGEPLEEVEARDDDEAALNDGSVHAVSLTGCSTSVVRGLNEQLLDEITCLSPDALGSIEGLPGVELADDALTVVQRPVVDALASAAAANGRPLRVTSALRTLPQQYILRRWASKRRCGTTMAAPVGRSNHEQGLAVDISMSGGAAVNKKIRASMQANGFVWLGSKDPVHFDYRSDDSVDLAGLSAQAFQRLWNRNHPEAPIREDGVYDATVEAKLKVAPAAGFPIGARCGD